MLEIGLVIYIFSLVLFFFVLFSNRKKKQRDIFYYVFPILFILTEALYVLPLSVRSLITIDVEGNISQYLPLFVGYIPFALVMCAGFNFLFTFSYTFIKLKYKPIKVPESGHRNPISLVFIFGLLAISFLMIYQLAADVGGVLNLILSGYRVTEILSKSGQYAIAFDWLVAISIATLFSGYATKSRTRIIIGLILIAILVCVFIILGRRGVLVVLLGSAIGGYYISVKKIPLLTLFFIGLFIFIALGFVGLTRGESYEYLSDVITVISSKGDQLSEDSPSMFYTVTTGNFAVPFETFPQIIRTLGDKFWPGFGLYSFRALSFFVPSFLWEDRPLPLSNWYMDVFYGETEKRIGRQFFFLTAPYMDFGPAGVLIFGFVIAWALRIVGRFASIERHDPLVGTFAVLLLANMLNFVSTDTLAFIIVFIKSYGIPLVLLHISRKFSWKRA